MENQNKKKILFSLKNVNFSYSIGNQEVPALHELNLEIPAQRLITISGPSGSGKSTLLNLLGMIEPLQKGEIIFENEKFSTMKAKRKNEIRKYHIGFIFQQFHLIPVLSAEENVAFFLRRQGLSNKEIASRTKEALTAVGLWESRKQKPSELSGGQKQRVAIARALAKKPQVIIGDEPTGSLDQTTARGIMELFASLVKDRKISIILTTHDPMVQTYAERNYHFCDGKLQDIPNVAENLDLGPSQSPGAGRSQLARISNKSDVEIAPAAGAFASVRNQVFSDVRYTQ